MADPNYRVIRREDDMFAVEVIKPGTLPQSTVSFATEAEADAWIVQNNRLRQAADPFRTPAHRKGVMKRGLSLDDSLTGGMPWKRASLLSGIRFAFF